MSNLKYAVVGTGALGSIIGAMLKKGGADVCLVNRPGAHINAIAQNGLDIDKGSYRNPDSFEKLHVDIKTATDPADAGKADIIIVLVKGNATEAVVPVIRMLRSKDSIILTLQNGIGNVELLERYFPPGSIAYGVTTISSMMLEPGHIRSMFPDSHHIYVGSDNASHREVLLNVCEDFCAGGCQCSFEEDAKKRMWTKAAMNCSGNALMGILRLNARQAGSFESYVHISRKLLEEIYAVAKAKGIDLDREEIGMYRPVMPYEKSTLPANYASTAQDIKRHKKTEIEFLNGAIVREGEALGIPTPYNDVITKMVDVLENSYDWQF